MNQRQVVKIIFLGMFVFISGFWNQGMAQSVNDKIIEEHFLKFEQGDYEHIDEFLNIGDGVLPVLLNQARDARASNRLTALYLLRLFDLENDGVLNKDEVIQTILRGIDVSETNGAVVDEALRSLEFMDRGMISPPVIKNLLIQLENGHERAALILGQLGDKSLIPLLEPYLANQDKRVADAAKQAMAKLGDKRSYDEIVAELAIDGRTRIEAMKKLAYIGNKSSVQEIAKFLYDSSVPPKSLAEDVGYNVPYCYAAAMALGQIIEDPPIKENYGMLSKQDLEGWRTWWEAHQHEY
jgi:hypothetical protein